MVGEPIAKADAEFVRACTGFAIGGVATVSHAGELASFVERSLADYAEVWGPPPGIPTRCFA